MAEVQKKKKKAKKAKQEIVLTPEEKFAQLLALKKATRCILGIEDKYKVYVRLTKDFEAFGNSEEAKSVEGADQCAALSEECRKMAEQLEGKLPTESVRDDRTVTTTVKEREQGQKKSGKAKWIVLAVVLLVAVGAVAYNMPPTRYVIAGLEEKVGLKPLAAESYEKLGDYKDCAVRKLETEKKILAKTKAGNIAGFGREQWIILENTGQKVCLARYNAMTKTAFHNKEEKATWETCSLRRYLNGDFLKKTFNESEQQAVLDTSLEGDVNSTYGTKGSSGTTDKVFILNDAESKKYKKQLGEKRNNMRLRTPGRDLYSTAYVTAGGAMIDYGFPVNKKEILIRPVIWVQL